MFRCKMFIHCWFRLSLFAMANLINLIRTAKNYCLAWSMEITNIIMIRLMWHKLVLYWYHLPVSLRLISSGYFANMDCKQPNKYVVDNMCMQLYCILIANIWLIRIADCLLIIPEIALANKNDHPRVRDCFKNFKFSSGKMFDQLSTMLGIF